MPTARMAVTSDVTSKSVSPEYKMSPQEAKRAWFTRIDASTWDETAKEINEIAQQATEIAILTEACDSGDDVACTLA